MASELTETCGQGKLLGKLRTPLRGSERALRGSEKGIAGCCAMCTKLGGNVAESLVTIYIDKCVKVWYNDDNEGRRDSATERYNLKRTI